MNSKLRQELFISAILGGLVLLTLFISPLLHDDWPSTRQRLIQSLLIWALVWQQLWRNRLHNRSSISTPLLRTLGWANRLTLFRGALIAACAGFLWLPIPNGLARFMPALCYSLAAIGDRFDGALARRTGTTTLLGARLDMSYDAIGLVVAPLLAITYGKIHMSYLLVSVAYYFFLFGLRRRRQRKLPVLPLPPSALRRTLAGTQMAFVAIALWPPIQPMLSVVTSLAFMLPLLLGFCYDWLVVSTRISLDKARTQILLRQLASLTSTWLLPLLRLLLVIVLLLSVLPTHDPAHTTLVEWGILLAAAGILIGCAGRSSAIALLLLLNWCDGYNFTSTAAVLTQFAAVAVIVFGTGRLSLWHSDDGLIARQGAL